MFSDSHIKPALWIVIIELSEPGLAKATFQVGPKHINALQTMHGAFAMLLLDVLTILGLQAHVSFFVAAGDEM